MTDVNPQSHLQDIATGARLHYVETMPATNSNGQTALVIHGRLQTGADDDMQMVADWLAGLGYRVIAPTLRGYGQSTPKPRDFPIDFYQRDARDLLALMDALDIPQAHILGYSDGGEVALILAGIAPDRALSTAVWGAVGYFGQAMRPVVQRSFPGNWITDAEVELHGLVSKDAFVLDWIKAMKHYIDSGGDVSVSLAPKITCPVLLMLGKLDTLNPAEFANVFLNGVKQGRLELFDCGHPVHIDQWDAFRRVVDVHLQTVT